MDAPIEEPAAGAPVVLAREQRVAFYGDNLPAGQLADGTILVPLRPICEALGLGLVGPTPPAATRSRPGE